jgi:hypothetical protein
MYENSSNGKSAKSIGSKRHVQPLTGKWSYSEKVYVMVILLSESFYMDICECKYQD